MQNLRLKPFQRVSLARDLKKTCFRATSGNPDVIALGNICLDVFVEVSDLPSHDVDVRRRLLDDLTRSPPGEESWEVGGNCNFMIAAARLGMSVGSLGHVGNDVYGQYVDRILQVGY